MSCTQILCSPGLLREAGVFVSLGLTVCDHSFFTSSVYSTRLLRLPFCFFLAIKDSVWGSMSSFSLELWSALQREFVTVCTVFWTPGMLKERRVWWEGNLIIGSVVLAESLWVQLFTVQSGDCQGSWNVAWGDKISWIINFCRAVQL